MVDPLKKLYFFGFLFLWFLVSLGLHQRNDDFVPVAGEFLQNFKLILSSLCYLLTIKTLAYINNDTGWGFNDNSSPAFLEPTVEDGDFLTGPASFLAAKAVNVVFFPGKYYIVTFLELAEEDREFFPGTGGFLEPAANFFMGAAALLEPTEEGRDFLMGVLVAAKAGNVVFFIRTATFLEPTEDNGDYLAGVLATLA
jgi:hypothetical protein